MGSLEENIILEPPPPEFGYPGMNDEDSKNQARKRRLPGCLHHSAVVECDLHRSSREKTSLGSYFWSRRDVLRPHRHDVLILQFLSIGQNADSAFRSIYATPP